MLAASRRIELPPYAQRLSVKAVIRGAEHYEIDGRTLLLDEDNYLIVNDDRTYSSRIAADRTVETFSIFFEPGFARDIADAVLSDSGDVLEREARSARGLTFSEHLRPHDRLVTPALRRIRDRMRGGMAREAWLEQQLVLLLEAMVRSQHRTHAETFRLPFVRPATRREVFRRIALATDHLHENFRRDLALDELARIAHLSKYHFIKLFEAVHGRTPHAFLQRKRASVAVRLLATTQLPLMQIAALSGFTCRATLYREIRRLTGMSGQQLRAEARRAREDQCARERAESDSEVASDRVVRSRD